MDGGNRRAQLSPRWRSQLRSRCSELGAAPAAGPVSGLAARVRAVGAGATAPGFGHEGSTADRTGDHEHTLPIEAWTTRHPDLWMYHFRNRRLGEAMLDKPVSSVILVGPGGLAHEGDACLWLACDLPSPGSGGTGRRDFIGVWSNLYPVMSADRP